MAWQTLGTVTVNYDWQFLAVPVLKYSLFRITQSYLDSDYVYSKITIAQAFNSPKEFYNYRGIYPSHSQKIIKLETPEELRRDEGTIINKYLGFKFDERFYRYSIPRQIQVQVNDIVSLNLDDIRNLEIENRTNIALLQASVDRIEQAVNSTP